MFGHQNPPPTVPTQDDALTFIVQTLRDTKANLEDYHVNMTRIFDLYLKNVCKHQDYQIEAGYRHIAPIFYVAAWELCRRGVLRPGTTNNYGQVTGHGEGYTVTPTGAKWIKEAAQGVPLPIEPGRFSKLLDNFASRFGASYGERSQEALRCYGASAYLGCCAMCGAAAESILLGMAIAKDGDQQKIENLCSSGDGRGEVENLILASQRENVQTECRGYLSLLKYWGDLAPHGKVSGVTEAEAHTALMLLLRLAQLANDRWDELTKQSD
jgi:hypothetical protein